MRSEKHRFEGRTHREAGIACCRNTAQIILADTHPAGAPGCAPQPTPHSRAHSEPTSQGLLLFHFSLFAPSAVCAGYTPRALTSPPIYVTIWRGLETHVGPGFDHMILGPPSLNFHFTRCWICPLVPSLKADALTARVHEDSLRKPV